MINGDHYFGPTRLIATKSILARQSQLSNHPMTAVAVGENGTETYGKILRFMYTVSSGSQSMLNSWIAVPKPGAVRKKNFFNGYEGEDEMLRHLR